MIIKDERKVKKEKVQKKYSPRWIVLGSIVIGFVITLSVGFGLFAHTKVSHRLDKWMLVRGQIDGPTKIGLKTALKKAIKSYRSNSKKASTAEELPIIDLQIKFKHYHKLLLDRNEAIDKGFLAVVQKHTVPAELKYGDKKFKAKIRLKGDMIDHILDKFWSFRIDIKKGERLFGMSRLSFQHPRARDFQVEKLIFDHLQDHEILTTRYRFIRLYLNGEDYGVYALEEHFTKDLLESQKRKEAPIIKFDETLGWHGYPVDNWHGPFTAKVDYFSKKRIKENPVLITQTENAVSLMRGFVEGRLSADEAFDIKKMADYMAILELWDVMHGFVWNNLRFYYNPYVAKLEPLAYDLTALSWKLPHTNYLNSLGGMHFFKLFLQDEKFKELFFDRMKYHSKEMLTNNFMKKLSEREEVLLAKLRRNYPFITEFDKNVLMTRAAWGQVVGPQNYRSLRKGGYFDSKKAAARYPAKAYINKNKVIELHNFTPYEISVEKVEIQTEEDKHNISINEVMAPGELFGAVGKHYLNLDKAKLENMKTGSVSLKINKRTYNILLENYLEPATESILHNTQGSTYSFLKYDHNQKNIKVSKGVHRIKESLITPEGYSFEITGGTTLLFGEKANLVIKGALIAKGSKNNGIYLNGINGKNWPGLVVIAPSKKSFLEYVYVKNTSGVKMPGYFLTGGVNFYQANIECYHCSFEDNIAEDALNIVHADFTLKHARFNKTRSDAFDGDFSRGKVLNSEFKAIGGDAIDFSGSDIYSEHSKFDEVNDKAISVGEQSKFTGKHLTVTNSGTGIAVKDWSSATISHSDFIDIKHVGVMAYMKKNLFGPAKIEANKLTFKSTPKRYLAQERSSIIADGVNINQEDIDIESLYKHGHMKK